MNKYKQAIIDVFLDTVKTKDDLNKSRSIPVEDYYYSQVSTSEVASKLNLPVDKVRRELIKLEVEGIVEADRRYVNFTKWQTDVPGFKKYKYKGFMCRK